MAGWHDSEDGRAMVGTTARMLGPWLARQREWQGNGWQNSEDDRTMVGTTVRIAGRWLLTRQRGRQGNGWQNSEDGVGERAKTPLAAPRCKQLGQTSERSFKCDTANPMEVVDMHRSELLIMACVTNFHFGRRRSKHSPATIVVMVSVMEILRVMVRHDDGDGGSEQEAAKA